jgi:hypothetical protein
MKTVKRFIFSLSTLLLLSGTALAVPVSARDATSGSSGTNNTTTTADDPAGHDANQTEKETEVENHAHDLAEQFKQQAQTQLAADKTKLKVHTEAERQKACTERKADLTKRMAQKVTQAQAHKTFFDNFYTRLKNFHDTKNLTVANYDALTAAADTAQANAAASISALQSLDVSVDCTSQTVASSVSTFQQALKSTRDSLNTYRSSLVDIAKALKTASAASTTNPTNQ